MRIIAQNLLGQPEFTENKVLDDYELHFGEWIKQIVDWSDQNLDLLLRIIKWPFRFFFELLMDDTQTSIMDIPWYWVAILFFVIGSIARNTRIGVMSGVLVAACGLLGPDYWSETTLTFGMIFLAVLFCALIGIPMGIIAGRSDAAWNVLRPILDAMQVVHPFVYMLPFIFFFKIGEPSALMATMVFALPPLVRLTNLGIRQVPEDVIEASRSYGATEARVLTDVQLPLARPIIMTGLNQTLLMAISMLGIAALMGAGGLGKLLLRAINSNDLPLAASGGLAYFLVAVVLDRISQRESDDGLGLVGRIVEANKYFKDPEGLLAAEAKRAEEVAVRKSVDEVADDIELPAPVSSTERLGLMAGIVGSVLAVVSVFLPWSQNAGHASAWGRRNDVAGLNGETFSGIEASGGTIFAWAVLGFSILALAAAIRPLISPSGRVSALLTRLQALCFMTMFAGAVVVLGLQVIDRGFGPLPTIGLILFAVAGIATALDTVVRGTPRLGSDGLLITAAGALAGAIGHLMLRSAPGVEGYSHGFGVWLAIIGAGIATSGGLAALSAAPYAVRRPMKLSVAVPKLFGALLAGLIMFAGVNVLWLEDARLDNVITPEMQQRIDELEAEAEGDINKQIANAQEITNIINLAQSRAATTRNAVEAEGPGLGWPVLAFGLVGVLGALEAAGALGGNETRRWRGGTIAAAGGIGAFIIPMAWIFAFTRSGEPKALTGVGAITTAFGAVILISVGMTVVNEFRRRKVYVSAAGRDTSIDLSSAEAVGSEEQGALVAGG